MPKIFQDNTPTSKAVLQFCGPLAIRSVGTWYLRSLPINQSTEEVSDCCMRIFHKVGEGKSCSDDHSKECEKIPMGKHYLSIWCFLTNYHWKWAPAERWQDLSVLQQPAYCHEPLFSMPPINERPSKVIQQEHLEIPKKMIGWREGFMGRRITKHTIDNPNNSTLENKGHTL